MSAILKDLGLDPWGNIHQFPTWHTKASPTAFVLFSLYYRQMFKDKAGPMVSETMHSLHRLWVHSREKTKWKMIESLVHVIHTIQTQEDIPLVHPCVILQAAAPALDVIPADNYLDHCFNEPTPVTVDLPFLFKYIAFKYSFMGIAGRYMFRYYVSVYLTTMLGIHPDLVETHGVTAFVHYISLLNSRKSREYYMQLGNGVLWG